MENDTSNSRQPLPAECEPPERKRGRPRKYQGTPAERAAQALIASRARQKDLYYASLANRKKDAEAKVVEGKEPFSTLLAGSEIGFLRREAARDGLTIAQFLSRLINAEWDRRSEAAYQVRNESGTE